MPIRAARRWTRALLHRLQALSSRHYNFRYFMRVAPDQIALLLILSVGQCRPNGAELSVGYARLENYIWTNDSGLPEGTSWLIRLGPQRLVELLWRYGYPDLAVHHKQQLQALGLWKDDGH